MDPPPLLFLISVPICVSLSVVETGNLLDALSAFLRKLEIDNIFFSGRGFCDNVFGVHFLIQFPFYLGLLLGKQWGMAGIFFF